MIIGSQTQGLNPEVQAFLYSLNIAQNCSSLAWPNLQEVKIKEVVIQKENSSKANNFGYMPT